MTLFSHDVFLVLELKSENVRNDRLRLYQKSDYF